MSAPNSHPREPLSVRSHARAWLALLLRLGLVLLPALWLSQRVDLRDAALQAGQLGKWHFAAAVATQLVSLGIGALRWGWLLEGAGAVRERLPGLVALFRHILVGQYYALLPSGLVGDAVRAGRVATALPTPEATYAVLLVDRLAGLAGLALFALAALLVLPGMGTPGLRLATLGGAALVLLGVAGVLVLARLPRVQSWVPRREPRLLRPLRVAAQHVGQVHHVGRAMLASVVTQALTALVTAHLLVPLEPEASVGACALAVPAVTLATFIPITPAGLGQREVAFVSFFGLVGVRGAGVVSASLLMLAVNVTVGALGGALLAAEHLGAATRGRRSPR